MPITNVHFLVPRILYGTLCATDDEWMKVVEHGYATPDQFSTLLQELEMVDVSSNAGKIVIFEGENGTEPDKCHCRLSSVPRAFDRKELAGLTLQEWRCGQHKDIPVTEWHDLSSLQKQFILQGTEYLWFAVAMFQAGARSFAFVPQDEGFLRSLLQRFLYWLPEIVRMVPRLVIGLGSTIFVRCNDKHNWWLAWTFLLYLIEAVRHGFSSSEMIQLIGARYDGNVIEALLYEEIIEWCEDRLRLKEV